MEQKKTKQQTRTEKGRMPKMAAREPAVKYEGTATQGNSSFQVTIGGGTTFVESIPSVLGAGGEPRLHALVGELRKLENSNSGPFLHQAILRLLDEYGGD